MNDQSGLHRSARLERARRLCLFAMMMALMTIVVAVAPPAYSQAGPQKPDAPRIVGGREAEPGEWPWQVALIYAGGDPYDDQFCGGTLINPLWVVTAAHCADGAAPNDLQVLAGIHNLVDTDPGFVRLDVARIIIHPAYGQINQYDSDIALLQLATPAPFRLPSAAALPITSVALVPESVGPLVGVESTVTGWGNRQPGSADYPATLHEVEVPIVSNAACRTAYGDAITDAMLCAGVPEGGKDSCQGDSGGPLVVFSDARSRWELAGIVSWGNGCALPGVPGVYTRVGTFARWVAQETGVGEPDFSLSLNPGAVMTCAGTPAQSVVTLSAWGGFNRPVALSLANLPAGGSATFQPATATPPATSTLLITTAGVSAGQYDLLVRGAAQDVIHGATLTLTVVAPQTDKPQLLQPPSNSLGVSVAPLFAWTAATGADRYRLEIAADPAFQNIVHSATIAGSIYRLEEWLEPAQAYYWRVRAENLCGPGAFSAVARLTTGRAYCRTPNLAIPDVDGAGVTDSMTLTAGGTFSDLDVYVSINHTFVGDLTAHLTQSPGNRAAQLFTSIDCAWDDVDVLLDDEGEGPVGQACSVTPPAVGGALIPEQPLSAFDGQTLAGTWRLQVADRAAYDTGTLVEWCLLPSQVTTYCRAVTDVPATECAALEALFSATDGWRWGNRGGWLNNTQACQWHGVTCTGGHVTRLQLANNGLAGPLPAAIDGLSRLQTLDLSGNAALAGPLPNTMIALPLDRFWFNGTTLCAPASGNFANWLAGIDDLRGTGRTCTQVFLPLMRR